MKKSLVLIVSIFLLSCMFYCPGFCAQDSAPKKVIIDTDMGWDDVLSTLYLLKHPDIEITGMAVTGCGETNLKWARIIARTLMELGGRAEVDICAGTDEPLKFTHKFPQSFKDDMNDIMGLLGTLNPRIEISEDPRPAWQYLSETLNRTDEKITILALGGFTNLAKMLELYPETKLENIERVYAMAGAVFVDGNVAALNNARPDWNQGPFYSTNHYAEWNIFVDPLAAKIVFDSDIPLTLVPLDACYYVMLSPEYIKGITADDSIARLAKNILEQKTGAHDEGIPVPIFDPLATMIMAGGMKTWQVIPSYLDICLKQTREDNQCGRVLRTTAGSRKVNIVQGVSNYQFDQDFNAVLNR